MKIILLTSLVTLNLFAHCLTVRAGLDIGSGATKVKIAKVDTCKNKIIKMLVDTSFPVGYKSDLKNRNKDYFSKKIMNKGFKVFHKISTLLEEYNVKETSAVATSAFRTSSNSQKLVKKVKEELGISIQVITQNQEALLGYKSARKLAKSNNYVVWDIGGGSMQVSFKKNKRIDIYEGHLAAVPFRAHITKNIQKTKKTSPNPMSAEDVKESVSYAMEYALKDVNPSIQEVMKKKNIDIIGIGGVHSSAILGAMKRKGHYTRTQLQKFLDERKGLTDEQIGGKYASTSTSNLALVLGFMQALKVERVYAGKVNLCDGLLLNK